MTIHHTHKKQATKRGYMLEEAEPHIRAFWPERAITIYAQSSAEAVRQMQAAQAVCNGEYTMVPDGSDVTLVHVFKVDSNEVLVGSPMTPVDAHGILMLNGEDAEWTDSTISADALAVEPTPTIERSEAGVPLDGAVAKREGYGPEDNPYDSETGDDDEYDRFSKWGESYEEEGDEEEGRGSVVKDEFRIRYAEAGHPTTCGDNLATILDNLCLTEKSGTDLGRFETICEANGVNLGKYNRTTNGWQGRLRMTGRNLLAKRVWLNGGILMTPVDGAEPSYQMSEEWMASQRFSKEG